MTDTAQAMRDRTAVSGVGLLLGKYPERTSLSLAVEAYDIALADAGLERKDVDGIIQLSYGYDYDRFLEAVGADVRYAYQGWSHGRFGGQRRSGPARPVGDGQGPLRRCRLPLFPADRLRGRAAGPADPAGPVLQRIHGR
jgi:hypothetical protein